MWRLLRSAASLLGRQLSLAPLALVAALLTPVVMLAGMLHCEGQLPSASPLCIGASTARVVVLRPRTAGQGDQAQQMQCIVRPPALTCVVSPAVQSGEKQGKVTKLSKSEVLMLNIGSMCTGAKVLAVRSRLLIIFPWRPVDTACCAYFPLLRSSPTAPPPATAGGCAAGSRASHV
jgi:Initiation factor eIF2 gamma, C terminal